MIASGHRGVVQFCDPRAGLKARLLRPRPWWEDHHAEGPACGRARGASRQDGVARDAGRSHAVLRLPAGASTERRGNAGATAALHGARAGVLQRHPQACAHRRGRHRVRRGLAAGAARRQHRIAEQPARQSRGDGSADRVGADRARVQQARPAGRAVDRRARSRVQSARVPGAPHHRIHGARGVRDARCDRAPGARRSAPAAGDPGRRAGSAGRHRDGAALGGARDGGRGHGRTDARGERRAAALGVDDHAGGDLDRCARDAGVPADDARVGRPDLRDRLRASRVRCRTLRRSASQPRWPPPAPVSREDAPPRATPGSASTLTAIRRASLLAPLFTTAEDQETVRTIEEAMSESILPRAALLIEALLVRVLERSARVLGREGAAPESIAWVLQLPPERYARLRTAAQRARRGGEISRRDVLEAYVLVAMAQIAADAAVH